MSDIEIARAANMQPITDVAEKVGIPADALEPYGNSKAKLSQEFIKSLEGRPDGKLILVTAITPQVDYALSNFANRMDVVNATVGIHTEIARHTTLRVGGVFPLTDGTDRLFDAEVQIQLNRYF